MYEVKSYKRSERENEIPHIANTRNKERNMQCPLRKAEMPFVKDF
jgi:hypothetical protein